MSNENEVCIRLGGDALNAMNDWIERREKIHDDRIAFGEKMESPALYTIRNDQYVTGWIGEAKEPHLRVKDTVFYEGENRNLVGPDKRYKKGKRLARELGDLAYPAIAEVFDVAGIPHHYIRGHAMRVPGVEKVDGDWYAKGIHVDQLNEANLCDGCEILKDWELLRLKDEVSEGAA